MPAVVPGYPDVTVTTVVGNVVALELRPCRFNNQHLAVVLPAAGFKVERGMVDGVDLGRGVAAFMVYEAQDVAEVLAVDQLSDYRMCHDG